MASCAARSASAEQMALLVGEGDHAVGVGEVVVVRQHRGAEAQHPRRVAEIEAVVLGDLGECQVAREMRGRMRAECERARDVAVGPGAGGRDGESLALGRVRGGGLGAGEIGTRARRPLRALQEQPRDRRVGVGQRAVGVGVGRADHLGGARLVGEEPLDEGIDAGERRRVAGGHDIAAPVPIIRASRLAAAPAAARRGLTASGGGGTMRAGVSRTARPPCRARCRRRSGTECRPPTQASQPAMPKPPRAAVARRPARPISRAAAPARAASSSSVM